MIDEILVHWQLIQSPTPFHLPQDQRDGTENSHPLPKQEDMKKFQFSYFRS